MLGYLLLLLLFFLFFSLSFYFGVREWRRPCDAVPLPMDVEYVRVENYFGQSFRAKMREWLAEAQPDGAPARDLAGSARVLTPGGEHVLTLAGGRFESRHGREEIVYSEEDLTLGGDSVFRREIYCQRRLETEAGVKLQSVAADGDLILGAANDVARWVDAQGSIAIGSGTVVRSRVSSLASIALEREVTARSLYAPRIVTKYGAAAPDPAANPGEAEPLLQAPASANDSETVPPYLEGLRCSRLEQRTWLVQGDLDLPPGSRVEGNLVVQGTLTADSDCLFAGDVKAARVKLGDRNRVQGNLVSNGSLDAGEASFVEKNVAAGRDIRLRSGARVGRADRLAAISAGGEIILEENVAVCGKAAAGRWIRTV
ncbi:MAG: hypothetical protein ACRD88_18115 [Terriglobia bacterium]